MFLVFDTVLKLLSPIMPFLSEELYSTLCHHVAEVDSTNIQSVHKQSFPVKTQVLLLFLVCKSCEIIFGEILSLSSTETMKLTETSTFYLKSYRQYDQLGLILI